MFFVANLTYGYPDGQVLGNPEPFFVVQVCDPRPNRRNRNLPAIFSPHRHRTAMSGITKRYYATTAPNSSKPYSLDVVDNTGARVVNLQVLAKDVHDHSRPDWLLIIAHRLMKLMFQPLPICPNTANPLIVPPPNTQMQSFINCTAR